MSPEWQVSTNKMAFPASEATLFLISEKADDPRLS